MAKFRRSPAEGVAINQTRSCSKHASNSARAQAQISGSLRAVCNVKHWLRLVAQRTFVRLPLHRLNGANGMSDIEGKVTRVGASERGQRMSFNGANGMSYIEGRVTRAGASERGQRTSFNGANGMSDIEGKVTRVGASERGQR